MNDEKDVEAILARRNALLRRAVRSLGAVAIAGALVDCSSTVGGGNPDGSVSDARSDTAPQPCLAQATDVLGLEASAQPCLGVSAPDSGADADASAQPCLAIAIDGG